MSKTGIQLAAVTLLALLSAGPAPQRRANRLAQEKSPYLLQHAHNPVDWYPWGEAAFEKARRENKLIFLSVGYSTCYWCHVMEREVFENEEIAAQLNRHFVSIKVDREERPDVDRIYMAALLELAGSGGWPMSMFLTPDRRPFYGDSYIPPAEFRKLSEKIQAVWTSNPKELLEAGQKLTSHLRDQARIEPAGAALSRSILTKGFEQFRSNYDDRESGFGVRMKFPRPVGFNFLLRYHRRFGEKAALDMTLATLRAMARGGIYDHLGGGFHRYTVDRRWRVPHFEKMLYDQALLVGSYLDAYQITHDDLYASVARETLAYVRRNLTGPEGGFYSAEDAESATDPAKPAEKHEGAFYLWAAQEIDRLLPPEQAKIFRQAYGVEASGNAPEDPHQVFTGKNILYLARPGDAPSLAAARARLFAEREKRPRPHLDDKVIVSWNGLMISAFSRAHQALEDPTHLAAAQKAASFILTKLYDPKSHRLLRRYRAGDSRFDANLEDYAFLTMGLLDLYETDFDSRWLERAIELTERQIALFWDEKQGGFFDTSGADPTLLFRTQETYDGAEPSGNSVAVLNLLRLAQMTDSRPWRDRAARTLARFSAALEKDPESMPQMLVALDFQLDKPKQIILAAQRGSPDLQAVLREVHRRYIPNKVILLADDAGGRRFLSRYLPFLESMKMRANKATAYICENYACRLPTNDPRVVARLLDEKPPASVSR